MDTDIITAAEIIDLLRAKYPLYPIGVEQTGGECATVYVWPRGAVSIDDPWLSIGPGSYDWDTPLRSVFGWEDLSASRAEYGDDATYFGNLGALVAWIDGLPVMTAPTDPYTRCKATYPAHLAGKPVRCESAAGHDGLHGHSFAARYWSDPDQCDVCGSSTGACAFGASPLCSCWRGTPCRYIADRRPWAAES